MDVFSHALIPALRLASYPATDCRLSGCVCALVHAHLSENDWLNCHLLCALAVSSVRLSIGCVRARVQNLRVDLFENRSRLSTCHWGG